MSDNLFTKVISYIALGSNLQNPKNQILEAVKEISTTNGILLENKSSLYTTEPVGYRDQPDFINAVIKIETSLTAHKLLQELMAIEKKHGRVRTNKKNGPRTLDLDILLYGNDEINTPNLTIPHPRMWERNFVTMPLLEIAPHLRIK